MTVRQHVNRRLMKKAIRWFLILVCFLVSLHILLYFFSDYAIRKIEVATLDDMAGDLPGRWLDIDGNRVHIMERGSGAAVFLLHGFAGSTDNWEQTIFDDLPTNRRTICMDLYGMGFSERKDGWHYDFPLWADQLRAVMEAMRIPRASIVGFSLGGSVASVFAARYPQMVDRLVLISSLAPLRLTDITLRSLVYYIPGGGEIMLAMPSVILNWLVHDDDYRRYRRIHRIAGTRQALLTFMHEVPDFEGLRSSYRGIHAETLVIHGDNDAVVPVSAVQRVTPLVRDCRLIIYADTGHWVLGEAGDKLVEELRSFLY